MHPRLTDIAALKNQPAVVGLAAAWPLASRDHAVRRHGWLGRQIPETLRRAQSQCTVLTRAFGKSSATLWAPNSPPLMFHAALICISTLTRRIALTAGMM
jgi:hypothetical protein